MTEYLDICLENGMPTGQTIERKQAHRNGILHRTAHVWIVRKLDGRYQILLQKRSMNKDSFPGLYDTSSAGHIPAGTEPLDSALRELEEELGIRASKSDLVYIGTFRSQYEKVFRSELFRDNEVTRLYLYQKSVAEDRLTLQQSEVSEVRWFDLESVYEEIQHSRERICVPPGSLNLLREYLRKEQTQR